MYMLEKFTLPKINRQIIWVHYVDHFSIKHLPIYAFRI